MKVKLVDFDSRLQKYDELSDTPMPDQIKLMGLRKILTKELINKLDTDVTDGDSYVNARSWIDVLLARSTVTMSGAGAQAFPMELGQMGEGGADHPGGYRGNG